MDHRQFQDYYLLTPVKVGEDVFTIVNTNALTGQTAKYTYTIYVAPSAVE